VTVYLYQVLQQLTRTRGLPNPGKSYKAAHSARWKNARSLPNGRPPLPPAFALGTRRSSV